MIRILALAAIPALGAATRWRIGGLAAPLKELGASLHLRPFLSQEVFERFYSAGRRARAFDLTKELFRALRDLHSADYDAILVQREAALFGPPIVEWLESRNLPLILDFDDAIWMQGRSVSGVLRSMGKFKWLFRRADALIAGSPALLQGARALGSVAPGIVIPTAVPAETWRPHPARTKGSFANLPPRIGWVGTHSTAGSLSALERSLVSLRSEGHDFTVRIVGGGAFRFRRLEAQYAPWRLETEREEFTFIDIGLGPMMDTEWWRGKCAFKQVQYQCVGVPAVSSPIGAVPNIVSHGVTGLLAANDEEWRVQLRSLLTNTSLRAHLSRGARVRAVNELCQEGLAVQSAKFIVAAINRSSRKRIH